MTNRRKPKNKKKYKKGKSKNDSESSTPQSSTPSVEDERQQLVQGGACGSSDRESRPTEKTKGDARRTGSEKSPYRSTSKIPFENAPQSDHSSKADLLAVPDQESGTRSSRSPSKSPLAQLKNVLVSKKKSPNRSCSECNCPDKNVHQPKCPELKNLLASPKDKCLEGKSPKNLNEPKKISSNASQIVLKKKEDFSQSSSSSDPSVTEYFKNSSEPGDSHEKNLTVPDQASGACGQSSPSKRSPLSLLKNIFKPKRKSPHRFSDTECSSEEKSSEELESPKNKKHAMYVKNKSSKGKSPNRYQAKFKESSSSGSPSSKKNKGDSSNLSSGNSRHSSSKSSSNSDPYTVELSCSDKDGNYLEHSYPNKSKSMGTSKDLTPYDPQEGTSKDLTGYDPQEGTSMGPARYESKREPHSTSDTEIDVGGNVVSTIEQRGPDSPSPRRRSHSFSVFRLLRSVRSRHSSPRRYNWRDFRIQLRNIEWSWLEEIRRPRHPNVERDAILNDPDENERGLLRQVEAARPVAVVRRHGSSSPVRVRKCNCRPESDQPVYFHDTGCSRNVDLRQRRNQRRCRQAQKRF